jgi:hypothetical protein
MGNGTVVTIVGGERHEFPLAEVQRVAIFGSTGNDTIKLSDDMFGCYINAGAGNDEVLGGDGKDTITGGAGKNTLIGNGGDDRLNGSGGRDDLIGADGNDRLYGNGGNDTLEGDNGVDRLFGGDGDDILSGGGSNDKLYGEAGNDTLSGKAGADICDGGTGNDSAEQDGSDSLVNIETVKTVASPQSLAGKYTGMWPVVANPILPGLGQFELDITATGGSSIQGTFASADTSAVTILTGTVSGNNFTLGYNSPYSDIQYTISITGTVKGNKISGYASVKGGEILGEDGNFAGTRV